MFATLYLPNFYLQAALRHQTISAETPVGLIDGSEKKATIIQLNAAADAVGVRLGMTPSQGLARSLQLVIKVRSEAQEKAMQEILLQSGFSLSPYVEATGPGLCTVQFTDLRDLERKVSDAVLRLRECEIVAQAGISRTPDSSFLAAHLGRPVLQIDNHEQFLAALPIEILALSPVCSL